MGQNFAGSDNPMALRRIVNKLEGEVEKYRHRADAAESDVRSLTVLLSRISGALMDAGAMAGTGDEWFVEEVRRLGERAGVPR